MIENTSIQGFIGTGETSHFRGQEQNAPVPRRCPRSCAGGQALLAPIVAQAACNAGLRAPHLVDPVGRLSEGNI